MQFEIDGFSFKDVLLNSDEHSRRKWMLAMGGGNNAALTENGVENQYLFRDRVVRNKQYKLYINSKQQPEKFIDLLSDPMETTNLLDSLNSEERKRNFNRLREIISSFPDKDSDPKYTPNPAQPWDVPVTEKVRYGKSSNPRQNQVGPRFNPAFWRTFRKRNKYHKIELAGAGMSQATLKGMIIQHARYHPDKSEQ